MNQPPFRPPVRPQAQPRAPLPRGPSFDARGRGPGPAEHVRGGQPPAAIVPSNVLRALISQSRKRCASYVEMMQKFGQGLGQLDLEAQAMVRGREQDPEAMEQLREYFGAVRELAEQNERHVAQLIHQEVQFQGVLQTWLYGRPLALRRPSAPQGRQGPPQVSAPNARRAPIAPSRQAPEFEPPVATEADEVAIPPPEALSGYAAHALSKARMARPAPPPQPRPAIQKAQIQAPPARIEPKAEAREEAPAAPKPEKSNGPAAKPIEDKREPEAPPAAAEGEGT